jgi:DNA-directed RNA polymerase specialized sigma24 family protein
MLKTNIGIKHLKPRTCPELVSGVFRVKNINRKYSDLIFWNPLIKSADYKEVNLQSFSAGSKGVRKLINNVMLKLDKEDYSILYELYFKNTSIHQLSKKLNISRPAVRWRRDKALKRVKEIILKNSKMKM